MKTFLVYASTAAALTVLVIAGIMAFSKNTRLKQHLRAWILLLPALTFLGIVLRLTWDFPDKRFLYVLVPAVGLVVLLGFLAIRFCPRCGATLFNQNPFTRMKSCTHCGTQFVKGEVAPEKRIPS